MSEYINNIKKSIDLFNSERYLKDLNRIKNGVMYDVNFNVYNTSHISKMREHFIEKGNIDDANFLTLKFNL